MKILFTRLGNINVTPAFSRSLFASESFNSSQVIVDWGRDNTTGPILKNNTREFHFSKRKTLFNLFVWQFYLFRILLKEKPLIIFNMSTIYSFPSIIIYKIFTKTKIVYDCRDYFALAKNYNSLLQNIIIKIDNYIGKICSVIVVPDEYGPKYFREVSREKIIVVPNSVEDFGIRKKMVNGPIRLAYLGYLSKDRNLRAILELVSKNKNIELHIARNYISKNTEDIIPQQSNIFLYEKLTHKESHELLSKMDYCLITYDPKLGNHKYIQPTKFYDCLVLGLPFICSKGMVNLEKHTKGTTNLAVEYNSVDFGDLKKTDFSDYNYKLYEDNYRVEDILKNYRDSLEAILKVNSP